jgi:hypothetical protein
MTGLACERHVAPRNDCAVLRPFILQCKKTELFSESLLTLCLHPPYMPLTNEGGAPLAQMSSPL